MNFKQFLLAVLILFVVEHGPWRLLANTPNVLMGRPSQARVPSGTNDYWKAIELEGRLNELGWTVLYSSIVDQGVYGLTIPKQHVIYIEQSLSWDARYNVLTHEGAHTQQPAWLSDSQAEMFAESVALLMATDNPSNHTRYLARFKLDYVMMVLIEWQDIYRAAAQLEN